MEIVSIKALASMVIERNCKGNQTETPSFPDKKTIESSGRVRKPVRIYSPILNAFLWVVEDDKQAEIVRATKDNSEPVYTAHDIAELKKLSQEELKAFHIIKTVFPNAEVEKMGIQDNNHQL
jgi:hypothetical protein